MEKMTHMALVRGETELTTLASFGRRGDTHGGVDTNGFNQRGGEADDLGQL